MARSEASARSLGAEGGASGAGVPAARSRSRGRRWAVRLGLLVCVLVGALVLAELGLRSLLYGALRSKLPVNSPLRDPAMYVDDRHTDEFWRLRALLRPGPRNEPPVPDTVLGWTKVLEPGTYAHPNEGLVGDRKLILLYGDSNAECAIPPQLCFEGLLEDSDLGGEYALLNYGVGGYGLDQIYLLLRATLDRFAERDPIVVVSMLVDDDLARSMLTFRDWPKPRFRLVDGRLVEPGPVDYDSKRFLSKNRPGGFSYLYRLWKARERDPRFPRDWSSEEIAEAKALNGALLEAIRNELERRSLRYFFFLFYFEAGLRRGPGSDWAEDVLLEFMERTGAPYVSMKDFIAVVTGPNWEGFGVISGKDDPMLRNHFGDAGNRLAFEALRQGIEGRFGNFDFERVRRLADEGLFTPRGEQYRSLGLLDSYAELRYFGPFACMRSEALPEATEDAEFGLRAGTEQSTFLRIEFDGKAKRMRGKLRAVPVGAPACTGTEMELAWRLDGGEWTMIVLEIGGRTLDLDIPVNGAKNLELRVTYTGSDSECAWVAFRRVYID